jgi:putative DNA-invertase from lambdoid prophage Rac
MSNTLLYARVSTVDQTIEHQKTQAEAAGFRIDRVIEDHGVSGVNTAFASRPGGARLLDILRPCDVLVVRWVDRLGRNYQDVTDTIRDLMRRGVVVKTVINRMTFDGATTDPIQQAVRDALIGFMAATAQAQAEATKEAQRAGIEHAKGKAQGERGKYLGRKPSYTSAQLEQVRDMLAQDAGHSAISRATGLSRAVVWRIEQEPAKAESALDAWSKAKG